ncbi:RagB/SusD family nutrient uptake outer membrane protein [Flavivirga eckloniae]|uniref:RagB/SusD family nutrient uptake outer membrane protein n=1 Tax=Flavivirga eckloniae TaxID=1803846 RepID=A0A2K9PNT3_9FLAO|nr:RagB/SusD family nutrient uptake outer membrane protein [Flavivirga eckloniae]AUP78719.1 RagB/SusD family nutrient uptake outer membrane protein [Flavivirga eckloniae]
MGIKRNIKHKNILHCSINKIIIRLITIKSLAFFLLFGCSGFVDVDLPKTQLTSETVFNDINTATSAIRSVYAKMRDGGVLNSNSGFSRNLGLYADELDISLISNTFYEHTISSSGGSASWWSYSYNVIYAANTIIEGVEGSIGISAEDRDQLLGEARFIRAYSHFLLVQLYGPVPYVATTDYITNTTVSRTPVSEVYNNIINDLIKASNLLGDDISGERTRVYKKVSEALLSRVYLYKQDWNNAADMASNVINSFVLESDIAKVFLKNSSGTIWQLKSELEGENTRDGLNFIFTTTPGTRPSLSRVLVEGVFEPNDLRSSSESNWEFSWVKGVVIGTETFYHAYKYKEAGDTFILNSNNEEVPTSFEYPVIFRLAEQYLIRAEARLELGDIPGAQSDLNVIRNRAGLPNTTAATTNELLEAILQERRVEFFTEQGHRWFDLKRWFELGRAGHAAEVLAPIKPNWQDRDILFPVPQPEILLNPNLLPQNNGY